MADIFAQYGGTSLPEEEKVEPTPTSDPFAQYGGQAVKEQEVKPVTVEQPKVEDPFAQYGGESDYSKLKKEEEAYGFMDLISGKAAEARGGRVLTKATSNQDIKTIADHWKVNPEELRGLAPYFMALPPVSERTLADYAKRAAGAVGYGVFADVPQWIYKKLQDDPNMRNALDDVRDLSEGRLGAGEFIAYNLLPTPKIGMAAKLAQPTLGKALMKGAAAGSVYGLAGSKEGEELEGAAVGALAGGALSGAVNKLQTKLSRAEAPRAISSDASLDGNVDPKTKQISLEYAQKNENKIAEITDEAWSRVADSEQAIADAAIKKRALTDDEVNKIVEEQLSPDTIAIMAKGETGDVANRIAAEKLVASRREELAKSLTKEVPAYGEKILDNGVERNPTVDEILARASGAGKDEYFIDKMLGDSYVRTGQEQMTKLGIRATPDAAPILKLMTNAISDRQYGLKTIDETRGTNALLHFMDLNTNYNHMTAINTDFNQKLANVYKSAKKSDLVSDTTTDEGAIFRALDTNTEDSLPEAEREVAKQFRALWDSVPDTANNIKGDNIYSLNIQKRKDFGAPNVLVRPVDYVIRMNKKKAEVDADLLSKMGKTLDQLVTDDDYKKAMAESASLREYQGGLKFSYEAPIQSAAELQEASKMVARRGASNPRLQTVASTTLQREEKIPDFLREKNLFRLSKRYADNTYRTVFLRKPLAELVNQAKLLKAAGAEEEAKYVERLVADNLGIRAFSMARLGNEAKIKFAEAIDSTLQKLVPNPVERKQWVDTFRVLPELMSNLQYNIYPNVLGMNPKAHVAQLTQVFFKNAPELGGSYGYELTTKGFAQAVLALRTGQARKLFYDKVQQYGLEPSSFVREANEALADDMERAIAYSMPAKAIRSLSEKFMYTYGKMDTFNRAATVYMAEKLAADLNNNVAGAFKAVEKMPIAIRRELVKNKQNAPEQAKILAKYLNSVTQYNYNRPSMSEIGVVLGPLFSTFTKWPLATAGDIIADLRTKGLKAGGSRAVEKYGVTLLLAATIDNAIRYGLSGELDIGGDFKEENDVLKKFIGSGGFTSMAPIQSAAALLPSQKEKSLFTPPIVDAVYNGILNPLFTGDTEKAAAQGAKAVKTFVPGGFVYRFLMEDIPTYVTGEKPE